MKKLLAVLFIAFSIVIYGVYTESMAKKIPGCNAGYLFLFLILSIYTLIILLQFK